MYDNFGIRNPRIIQDFGNILKLLKIEMRTVSKAALVSTTGILEEKFYDFVPSGERPPTN